MIDINQHRVTNRGTVYQLTIIDDDGEDWYVLVASTDSYRGEWLKVPAYFSGGPSVSWSYLTEKMPSLARWEGDKEGWIKAFAEAGIEVFG